MHLLQYIILLKLEELVSVFLLLLMYSLTIYLSNCLVPSGHMLGNHVGIVFGNHEARGVSGKKYEAQIAIFRILLAINRFSRISWKAESH